MADGFEINAIRAEAIVAERTAILTYRRKKAVGIDEHVRAGRLTQEEGALCKRWLAAFADDIAIGLHVERDPDGVRQALREVVRAEVSQSVQEAE